MLKFVLLSKKQIHCKNQNTLEVLSCWIRNQFQVYFHCVSFCKSLGVHSTARLFIRSSQQSPSVHVSRTVTGLWKTLSLQQGSNSESNPGVYSGVSAWYIVNGTCTSVRIVGIWSRFQQRKISHISGNDLYAYKIISLTLLRRPFCSSSSQFLGQIASGKKATRSTFSPTISVQLKFTSLVHLLTTLLLPWTLSQSQPCSFPISH